MNTSFPMNLPDSAQELENQPFLFDCSEHVWHPLNSLVKIVTEILSIDEHGVLFHAKQVTIDDIVGMLLLGKL